MTEAESIEFWDQVAQSDLTAHFVGVMGEMVLHPATRALCFPGWHITVKGGITFSLASAWKKAASEAEAVQQVPVVFYQNLRHEWRAAIPLGFLVGYDTPGDVDEIADLSLIGFLQVWMMCGGWPQDPMPDQSASPNPPKLSRLRRFEQWLRRPIVTGLLVFSVAWAALVILVGK